MPAASAALNAAQLRALMRGPVDGAVEGKRVPSISIAISRILTPLFYLLPAPAGGNAPKCKPLKYHGLMPAIAYLECSRCSTQVSAETAQTLCPQCAGVLYVRYDMAALR